MRRLLLLLLVLVSLGSAQAIVWREDLEEPPSKAEGLMKQAGKVYYSPLSVFGSSCIALGGRWVLTCRHGTEKWSGVGLRVDFPALGKERYEVKEIIYPEKGDFALLKLDKKVARAKKVSLFGGKAFQGQRAWLGGFGVAGPAGKVSGGGKFHAGHNRVDGLRGGKISISLGKPDDEISEDDEAIIALFDSGSPLFLNTKQGWLLAGVASTASNGRTPGYGDRGNYARVSEVKEWVKTSVEEK